MDACAGGDDATDSGELPPRPSIEATARNLRVHLREHNARVVALSLGALVASTLAWILLYALCAWFFLVAASVLEAPMVRLPDHFLAIFVVLAICAVVYAWVDDIVTPRSGPADQKELGEIFADFTLLIPRMTLAIAGTLRAWQSLRPDEIRQASALLLRLGEEKRAPLSGVRLFIPDPGSASRVIFALQLTEVIEVHRDNDDLWLRLNALRPSGLRMRPWRVASGLRFRP